jgi:hypothetical protein
VLEPTPPVFQGGPAADASRTPAPRRVLFVGPNIYVVRNWLATGLVDACIDTLQIEPVFLTPFTDPALESPGGRQCRNLTVPANDRGEPTAFPSTLAAVRYVRHRLFAAEFPDGSLQLMALAERGDLLNRFVRAGRALAPRGGAVRRLLRTRAIAMAPATPLDAVLAADRYALIVVGSPGVQLLDHVVMAAARRAGVPVHCIVSSWDNLSSRGPLMAWPDRLLVWNEHMRDQAQRMHHYPLARVDVTGPLQFAQYAAPVTGEERQALAARLGLPAGQPYLCFVTGQHLPEYEAEDVAGILAALSGTAFGDLPLVVRVHPQNDERPLRAITDRRLVFDRAPQFSATGAGAARFDVSEVRSMATLLSGATAVLSSWATTALLEACVFDRPIVQLRWMDALPRQVPAQRDKIRRLQRYLHLGPLDAASCRLFSEAPADLASTLTRALAEDDTLRRGRAQAVRELASPPIGSAVGRVVSVLGAALAR